MMLTKQVVTTLCDLVENRLSIMSIHDQDDLREKLILQRALHELHGDEPVSAGVLSDFASIPRRGRRRKVGGMAEA